MTNEVNKPFADAARKTQAEVREHLEDVFAQAFAGNAARVIDRIADLMGRNIPAPADPVVGVNQGGQSS